MGKIGVGTVSVGPEAKRLINEALDKNRISQGRLVRRFERLFAAYHGPTTHAVAVGTGTAADTLALAALYDRGAQRGDEVVVPALTFIATVNAVVHAGFVPRFVDADPLTWQIDPAQVAAVITGRTRAILPVHLFGKPAPMDELVALAAQHDLAVVEDAAEAHGARYRGRIVGTLGLMGAFSFYSAHIITTGEGGAVITTDEDLAGILRSLRAHGRACKCEVCRLNVSSAYCPLRFQYGDDVDTRFFFERLGYSEKMNELEAALGIEQMARLDDIVEARRANLFYLNEQLAEWAEFFQFLTEAPHERLSPLVYPLVIRPDAPFTKRQITQYLEHHDIDTRPMFGSIPTQQPAYAFMGHRLGDFPHAEAVGDRGFYVGVHQDLTRADLDTIVERISEFIRQSLR
ncbi:MAG: DegT/DnrJ/EryC1/StrS family aminotransferase [Chloroflexi bacterium]|nr:DegT/DnrJ/EryC1/StrS family aminotransferase [Chloroflexota bacterium]MBU1749988.1 DegT/DnrJ/EryC1/StrS family aminotransferase [Chloroflexota bacterium]